MPCLKQEPEPELEPTEPSTNSSSNLTQETLLQDHAAELCVLETQVAGTERRLAAAVAAREQAENMLQVSEERSAALKARSGCI